MVAGKGKNRHFLKSFQTELPQSGHSFRIFSSKSTDFSLWGINCTNFLILASCVLFDITTFLASEQQCYNNNTWIHGKMSHVKITNLHLRKNIHFALYTKSVLKAAKFCFYSKKWNKKVFPNKIATFGTSFVHCALFSPIRLVKSKLWVTNCHQHWKVWSNQNCESQNLWPAMKKCEFSQWLPFS